MSDFSEEEIVRFDQVLEGFQDALVMSSAVTKYNTDAQQMERANDTMWRPMPYIAQSFDGADQTANFYDATQMSVPIQLTTYKSVPLVMGELEMRDAAQEGWLGDAAMQKLASDINVACLNAAATWGSVVVQRTGPATGFKDVAEAEASLNELGVGNMDRFMALTSRDYNDMADNLAARQTMGGKVSRAFEKAYLGEVAGFETLKLDYGHKVQAATATGATINGANQRHVPKATTTAVTGETSNKDNRYMEIDVAVTGGAFKAGDSFVIAGVNSVHHITKEDTGQLKTFKVLEVVSPTRIKITPAIIDPAGGSSAEKTYQNVTTGPADGAAITMLNTSETNINPFWVKDAIQLVPGALPIPARGSGVASMRATTDNGFSVLMTKGFDVKTMKPYLRWDTLFGVGAMNPEMMGNMIFV